jgi:ABC-type transport system involved in multi-copper enzyme maturation permease subunit
MISIIKYILLISLRNKLYLGIILSLILCFFAGIYLGETNIIEEAQSATVFIAGISRVIISLGIAIFVCLNISKLFDGKEIDYIISKPVSRKQFILSFLAGYLISCMLVVVTTITIINILINPDPAGSVIWSLSLICESLMIICFAFLCSIMLENSLLSIFATIGFYLLSRMMGFFTLSTGLPWENAAHNQSLYENILQLIAVIFPRIDLFTQSKWLIYGIENDATIKLIFIQSLIYIPLLVAMSFHDISKKEF